MRKILSLSTSRLLWALLRGVGKTAAISLRWEGEGSLVGCALKEREWEERGT